MSSILQAAGIKPRTSGISKRMQNIQISPIKQIPLLARDIPNNISLAWGIPSFPTPEHIRKAASEAIFQDPKLSYYSPTYGLPALLEAIARRLQEDHGVSADPKSSIAVTCGAMEGLSGTFATILDEGDEVILFSPSFPSYADQVKLYSGVPVYSTLDESRNFALDMNDLAAKISPKTKAIVLGNPNNPTGTVFAENDLREIARLASEHDFWIITDDPYNYLIFDNAAYFSPVAIPEIHDRLVTLRSFSKEYCMTGWRVGYVYAEAGFIREFLKFHDNTVVSVSTISQMAALAALEGPQDDKQIRYDELVQRRKLMGERLRKLDDLFETQDPQGAYYFFPKLKIEIDDIAFALTILQEAKVQLVPGSGAGPSAAGHVRFCFGYSRETINEAFDRIEQWWNANKNRYI